MKHGNHILTVMKKELRRFFGDRRMLMTLLLPGLLIYVIYSLMGGAMSNLVGGSDEGIEYRVLTCRMSDTVRALTEQAGLPITYDEYPDGTDTPSEEVVTQAIQENGYHAVLIFPARFDADIQTYDPASGQPAPEVQIYYNSSDTASAEAYSTLTSLLNALESSLSNRFDVNLSTDKTFDVATEKDLTGMIFSMLMPLLLIMLMFSSCMAMTSESIAGEKERGTIATLLITPVKRSELAIGKIAALSILSLLGGLCSFVGVLLSLPKLMGGETMNVVDASIYTVGDYAMILCIIFSTILVFVSLIAVLSALASSVKEAGSLISPLMLVVTVIGVSGMFGGGADNLALFLIPVYNSVQCISGVFSMSYEPVQVLVTVIANLITAGVFVLVLTRMFNSERIMFKK